MNNNSLYNKQILLGISGSIAAYKSADLVRNLREAGAQVKVVMTAAAKEFITPLTLQALSGNKVHHELLSEEAEAAMGHIELARWAELILIAPASADFIASLAQGRAHDLLTTLCLASTAPIMVAPAMNQNMWHNLATQANVTVLKQRQIKIIGPAAGAQACGDVGLGRMIEPNAIVTEISDFYSHQAALLAGKSVLITAGPTQEALDPVRYLTNHSSGKMGYAIAQAAVQAGAQVTLISGPTHLTVPEKVNCIRVTSTQEMYAAVMHHIDKKDIFIACAAVADYSPEKMAAEKIKKVSDHLTLSLKRNPDILSTVAALPKRPFVVGFAAETQNVFQHAKEKLLRKKLDMIVANEVGQGKGFEADENALTVITANQEAIELPTDSKMNLARELVALIAKFSVISRQ